MSSLTLDLLPNFCRPYRYQKCIERWKLMYICVIFGTNKKWISLFGSPSSENLANLMKMTKKLIFFVIWRRHNKKNLFFLLSMHQKPTIWAKHNKKKLFFCHDGKKNPFFFMRAPQPQKCVISYRKTKVFRKCPWQADFDKNLKI